HDVADGGVPGDDGDHAVDALLADRRRHVGAGNPYATLALEPDRLGARELREGLLAAEVDAALHREPGERAVHRTGVQVAEAEPLCERTRHRTLACAGRPVDRHDHPPITSVSPI